ncbi:AGAP006759-PA [Anopheles gambiae str. PEST]|uniref:AGAP006759-PA n=1 Tax=Anopheles gambiae TaxID=7165 RepID=A7US02_ANOGA|nr:AGAP006759-PA [Anopheles gambiae str. PEST]
MQLAICVWTAVCLQRNIIEGFLVELEAFPSSHQQPPKTSPPVRSCGETFNLTDPRTCCSIPYLLPADVVEPCLEIPLSPIDLAGESNVCVFWQCRAECALNRTEMLVDGHFQLETAMQQLTNATSEDSTLTKRIQYAIGACNELFLNCPPQYWTASDECNQLVRTLNNCPHFLVHTDTF